MAIKNCENIIWLVILLYRTDRSEKKRKELEHICNYNEVRIEKDETDVVKAKTTTRDAYEKYEETTRRLNIKEKVAEYILMFA
jgi:hypothetical protein